MIVEPTRRSISLESDAELVFVTVPRKRENTTAALFHVCPEVNTGASVVTDVDWEMRPVPEVRSNLEPTMPAEDLILPLSMFPFAQV
jgi:hypothetical protein